MGPLRILILAVLFYLGYRLIKANFSKSDDKKKDDEDGYQGATVLKPVVGSYWDGVAALDYKALYPTSEIG